MSIYSVRNEAGETPATYLRHNLRMDRSTLDYTRIARSFFAISSERDGVILYSRCNFSRAGRAIHCFDLVYPGEPLGLTFQQIQKYEKGINRIGANRLQQAADIIFGVTVPFFFEGGDNGPYKPDGNALSSSYIDDFVANPDRLRLAKAFRRIARPVVRLRVVALLRELAGEDGE